MADLAEEPEVDLEVALEVDSVAELEAVSAVEQAVVSKEFINKYCFSILRKSH